MIAGISRLSLTVGLVLLLGLPGYASFSYWPQEDPLEPNKTPVPLLSLYPDEPGAAATRIDDFGVGGVLDSVSGIPGSADDQVWGGRAVTATFKAIGQHVNTYEFGYDLGADGGFTKLFDVDSVPGNSATMTFAPGEVWAWSLRVYHNQHLEFTCSSNQSLNIDENHDHMLTYRMAGLSGGLSTWLLFFEDSAYDSVYGDPRYPGDGDYDEPVIEIQAVPEPQSLLCVALATLAVRRCRRRQLVCPD